RLATDANQRLLWSWNSDAFGVGPANPDVDGDGIITDIPLRFPGQLYDAHSALHYNYFRDYDPETGRYVESDPIGLKGGLNTYGYAYQNPINNFDPDGRLVWFLGLGALGTGTTATAGTGFWATGALLGGAVLTSTISGSTPTDSSTTTEASPGSAAEKARERKEYSRICKSPIPPSGDQCIDARANLERLRQCLTLRENFSKKWFNDNDAGHITEINNTRKAIENLEDFLRRVCREECN
ncbi:sugar-binding protein, partial [Pseudomonas sp. PIC25]|uniref:RHS repeat domain-containing protein n=1 Tax=Pseudomonas sp. PIC25 TaxID=1958773 RepID=UPI000BC69930